MRSQVSSILERTRAGLLLVPLAGLLLAVVFALVTVWLDATLSDWFFTYVITNDADAAREILSVVATSMLTFTGLVFTITIVVLQLAASHYSPRITRAFLRDRQTKLSFALFLGTFAYSLVVLRSVRTGDDPFIPAVSVAITYLLVFSSLVVFVTYLDHIAQSIRVSNIARRLAREGVRVYDRRLRPAGGEDEDPEPAIHASGVPHRLEWRGDAGILSHINETGLNRWAARADAVIALRYGVGDFIPHGAVVMEVRRRPGELEVSEGLLEHISVGPDRTPQQDLALPIRHLVDVALRGLSPGINDPTTAVQAIDYIHDLLRRLVCSRLPSRYVRGDDGRARLIVPRHSWDSLLALAVTEIRGVAADQVQVSRRVLQMLDDLHGVALPGRRPALEHQRRLWLKATGSELTELSDRRAAQRPDAQGLGAVTR